MKLKQFISTILVAAILALQFSWISFTMPTIVYAEETSQENTNPKNISTKYFYNQLTNDSKVFYNVMEEMYKNGDLKKGNISKEITENQLPGLQAKLDSFASGSQDLLNSMGAARDAFVADNPNIFYVDFDYFTMRVNQIQGIKHLYIGTGRSDNYINKEFLNSDGTINNEKIDQAINNVNNKINQIVKKAEDVKDNLQVGQDLIEQQVKVVHNEIAKMTKYTYEHQTEHPYTIRTTYGVFGLDEGNAVCSGMAKALKVCLDKLNIPCVLVQGIYRVTENQPEEHMWAYVELSDDKWYAVDVTFDNTDKVNDQGEEIVDSKYFLVGADRMYKHVPTGIMSESNFEFSYPELEVSSGKFDVIFDEGPLKVEIDDESYNPENEGSTSILRVSYNGHGCQKAIEEDGVYILTNFYQEGLNNEVRSSGWCYPRPDIYGNSGMQDTDEWIEFMVVHVSYLQVAVTDIAPAPIKNTSNLEDIVKQTTYLGTEESLMYKSEILYNPNGMYVAPPYVKRANPAVSSVQYIGKSYPVTIEYDDVLIPDESGEEPSVSVMIYEPLTKVYRDASENITIGNESHPRLNYKITDFKFDGTSTFTFNFTPSEMWADDTVYYIFDFKGLMGTYSHKKPLSTIYQCAHTCSAYAYTAQGFNLNVYGKPVLMDDNIDMSQMSLEGTSKEELSALADILKHRLTLVTTKTTKADDKLMNDELENYLAEEGENREVEATETYNINLTLCKQQQKNLKDGMGVRVMLGFPQGYGPDDAGVTFKAYHYKKNPQGEIIGVEEIPCTITPLGLIVEVYSFSPFTIAAVTETDSDKQNSDKSVIINSSEGGKVLDLTENGKIADTINTLRKEEKIIDEETTLPSIESKQFKIIADEGYEIDEIMVGEQVIDFSDNSNEYILNIDYDNLGEDTTKMIKIAFAAKSVHEAEKEIGAEVVTQPVVNNPSLTLTAKAYKVNDELKNEVTDLHVGDKFEITYSIAELSNLGEGINIIGGNFDYDSTYLDLDMIEGEEILTGQSEMWNYSYDKSTKKFTSDTIDHTLTKIESENILTLKFKVKENIDFSEKETIETIISLKNITAGNGKLGEAGTINVPQFNKAITITKIVEENLELYPEAQSKNVVLNDEEKIISLPLGITYKELNSLLKCSQSPKYHSIIESSDSEKTHTSTLVTDDSSSVATGDTITIGSKIWTFSVRGDVDGDSKLTVNDIGVAKSYYIGKIVLTGVYLNSIENDDTEGISVNDIGRLKLTYIGKLKDLYSDLDEYNEDIN